MGISLKKKRKSDKKNNLAYFSKMNINVFALVFVVLTCLLQGYDTRYYKPAAYVKPVVHKPAYVKPVVYKPAYVKPVVYKPAYVKPAVYKPAFHGKTWHRG